MVMIVLRFVAASIGNDSSIISSSFIGNDIYVVMIVLKSVAASQVMIVMW